jgi:CRISPR-associated protein Cmr1
MPRTIPISPPELKTPILETWTLKLKTITPMFGGSATPREVDQKNPVRAASVRGHLRFWWRALYGGKFATSEKLFEAEEAIWGSAKNPGRVALRVQTISKGDVKACCTYLHPTRDGGKLKTYPYFGAYPGYALFPFRGEAKRDKRTKEVVITEQPANCLTEVEFVVELSFPVEVADQVRCALAAWVKFGGIGARTRRGCGSIEATEGLTHVTALLQRREQILTLAPIKVLAAQAIGKEKEHAVHAWAEAVKVYQEFRQGKNYARDPGSDPNMPAKLGRSRYPEPDTIREAFEGKSWRHTPQHPVRGFPRADLGLPIVFHFQEEGPDDDFILESNSNFGARFASPVITKAVRVDGGYAPTIILLDAPHVWEAGDLVLKLGREEKAIPGNMVELTSEERKKVSPLGGLSIREALVEFAKSRGYEEVHL